ncbi:flagellar hook-associated protein 3 [Clostridium sp. DL-VIII]|uniref:flagellar hook-associated protein FlgL n=1 Tax=Clostridium sp. DL-VIII TaxID=641107 RepID=UPI00023B0643|nr:flagellar hook-associated protein FlgL [Clostridium sp. DL-VIII]EHJ01514.1 flagellar hook-associated protein 3 [Clostridium sp. DL-VIII]
MSSRITSNMLTSDYLRNVRRNMNNMQTLQNQLSTGKQIKIASDNPYIASRSMQLHSEMSYNSQYNENIKDTSNWLDTTDTALSQMGDIFGRIETLLVNAGNGTYEDDEKGAIQDEIKEKVNQLSQVLNTSFDGSYIFGGAKTGSKPTTVVDGKLLYANKDGSAVNITAYVDSTTTPGTNIITSNPGTPNTAVNLTTTPLTDAQKNALIAERDASGTSEDRKADITNILQGGNVYTTAGGVLTSEKYTNKAITLDATEIGKLQNELNGLDYTNAANNTRIDDINKLLYNASTPAELNAIKTNQMTLKDLPSPTTATAKNAAIDALNSASKIGSVNQINSYLNVDISQGVQTTYNKTAVDVLEFTDKNGKQISVSDLLSNIVRDLDSEGNANSLITTDLTDIQSVTANLLQKRSEVGSMQNRMESAQTNNESQNYNLTDILSKTEDIDITEKTIEYSTLQTVYTASLQTSAKVLPMTILNYL